MSGFLPQVIRSRKELPKALFFDELQVVKSLEFLLPPGSGHVQEIRITGRGVTAGYFENVDIVPTELRNLMRTQGLLPTHVTLNPVRRDLLARADNRLKPWIKNTTNDQEIAELHWLLIDIDPVRPADISSSDAELGKAKEVKDKVVAALSEIEVQFVPAMSGNGFHLLVPLVPHAQTPEVVAARKRLLKGLSDRFSTKEATVDTTVYNSARITKLYGTYACKGDPSPERPYRLSTIEIPATPPIPTDFGKLMELILPSTATTSQALREQETSPKPQGGATDIDSQLRISGVDFRSTVKAEGTWLNLFDCPVHIDNDGHHYECGIFVGNDGRIGAKCQHNPEMRWSDFKAALRLTLPAESATGRVDDRPEILVTTEMFDVVDQAESAILGSNHELYQRAGQLVRISRPPATERTKKEWLARPAAAPTIKIATDANLRELASRCGRWVRFDRRSNKNIPVLPPLWAIEILRDRGSWRFPYLEALVETPCLLPDGTVLDRPGYDPDTGILYDPGGVDFPPVPKAPTHADAMRAKDNLLHIFVDFPFVSACHRAAALAAVLTTVGRTAIMGNVPLFGASATSPATGKGLLVDAIAVVATGREAPRMSQVVDNEAEEEKRLLAVCLEGHRVVLIDNCEAPLGSAVLAKTLTAPEVSGRILGQSRIGRAPVIAVFFATGNNLEYKGDVPRRVVPIEMDAMEERPEEREGFKESNLLKYVRDNRPGIVVAALTWLRAYHVAGRPKNKKLTPFGSFEQWSDLVRGALAWVGEEDPNLGREKLRKVSDPVLQALKSLLAIWYKEFGEVWKPLRVVEDWIEINRASADSTFHPEDADLIQRGQSLKDALGALDKQYDGRLLRLPVIGKALAKYRGRIIGGLRLDVGNHEKAGIPFRVVAIRNSDGSPGTGDGVTLVTNPTSPHKICQQPLLLEANPETPPAKFPDGSESSSFPSPASPSATPHVPINPEGEMEGEV